MMQVSLDSFLSLISFACLQKCLAEIVGVLQYEAPTPTMMRVSFVSFDRSF